MTSHGGCGLFVLAFFSVVASSSNLSTKPFSPAKLRHIRHIAKRRGGKILSLRAGGGRRRPANVGIAASGGSGFLTAQPPSPENDPSENAVGNGEKRCATVCRNSKFKIRNSKPLENKRSKKSIFSDESGISCEGTCSWGRNTTLRWPEHHVVLPETLNRFGPDTKKFQNRKAEM